MEYIFRSPFLSSTRRFDAILWYIIKQPAQRLDNNNENKSKEIKMPSNSTIKWAPSVCLERQRRRWAAEYSKVGHFLIMILIVIVHFIRVEFNTLKLF